MELVYSDENTFTGSDPDPNLDADDEVVFMKRDIGSKYTDEVFSYPYGTIETQFAELEVQYPDTNETLGWVYLFVSGGDLVQGAGERRINYTFNLIKGDYIDNHEFEGSENGGNPEDTWVETEYYRRQWMENWLSDRIDFGEGTEDILLLEDFQFKPDTCGRNVNTFRHSRTAFVTNKVGALRSIRSWVGANSGTLTQRTVINYEGREDMITYLRVHAIPGIMEYSLFEPGSSLTWFNSENMEGTIIDGNTDEVDTAFSPWQLVAGQEGSYLRSWDVEQDILPEGGDLDITDVFNTWYIDNSEPDSVNDNGLAIYPNWKMCCSTYIGSDVAWGASGVKLASWVPGLPNTDPNRVAPWPDPVPEGACKGGSGDSLNQLTLHRRQLFLPPQQSPEIAQQYHDVLVNPLNIEVKYSTKQS